MPSCRVGGAHPTCYLLGLTVTLEAADFSRFESPGNYASCCRCVKSERTSYKKKKGEDNRKNGNKYLARAYVEAAHLIIRFCPEANAFYQQKKGKNQWRHSNQSIGQQTGAGNLLHNEGIF